jgi:hypothetical protein
MKKFARPTATVAAALLLATYAQGQAIHWSGPGWYGIQNYDYEEKAGDAFIIGGPLATRADCEAKLPSQAEQLKEDAIFYCKYLAEKPSWDV